MLAVSSPRAITSVALVLLSIFVLSGRYLPGTKYQQTRGKTMTGPLKMITVTPKAKHTATVIFMHVRCHRILSASSSDTTLTQGLGDTGYGWKPVADQLSRDSSFQHIKWVLPHA